MNEPTMTETPMSDGYKRVQARAMVPVAGQIYELTAEVLCREDVALMPVVAYQPDGSAIVSLVTNPGRVPVAVTHQAAPGDDPGHVSRGEHHPGWVGRCERCGNTLDDDQPYWWDE